MKYLESFSLRHGQKIGNIKLIVKDLIIQNKLILIKPMITQEYIKLPGLQGKCRTSCVPVTSASLWSKSRW